MQSQCTYDHTRAQLAPVAQRNRPAAAKFFASSCQLRQLSTAQGCRSHVRALSLQSNCVSQEASHRQRCIAQTRKAATPVHKRRRLQMCALNISSASPTAPESQKRSRLVSAIPLWRYRELLSRVCWTVFVILVARFGLMLKLPYVDMRFAGSETRSVAMEAMLGRTLMHGSHMFMLGVGPLINASILMSVILSAKGTIPALGQHLKTLQEQGADGQARIQNYINSMALFFAVTAGTSEALKMAKHASIAPGVPFITLTVILLAAGAMIQRWLADLIDTKGIGEGIGTLLAINIVTNYAQFLDRASRSVSIQQLPASTVAMLGGAFVALVLLASLTTDLALRLPLIYYKQRRSRAPQTSLVKLFADPAAAEGTSEFKDKTAYLPIRLSPNGMQPVIIASFVFHELPMVVGLFNFRAGLLFTGFLRRGIWFPVLYGLTVFVAAIIEVAESTPKQMTDYLNAIEAGVKDVSPGQATEEFLTKKMRHCRFWGGLLVALLAICAHYFDMLCHHTIRTSLGSMTLLLIVGVITAAIRQIQSLLQMPRLEKALQRERSILQRMSSA